MNTVHINGIDYELEQGERLPNAPLPILPVVVLPRQLSRDQQRAARQPILVPDRGPEQAHDEEG